MKFKHAWRRSVERFDIASVVEEHLSGSYAEGAVERAADTADRCAKATAFLFQKLHEKGLIDDSDVIEFTSGGYILAEDE